MMSAWINGLADKAENILNKIDENAAKYAQADTVSSLGLIKQSFSSSTQSLKSPLSPSKRYELGCSSVRSESGLDLNNSNKLDFLAIKVETRMTDLISSTNLDTQELAAFKNALAEITTERDSLRYRLSENDKDMESISLRQREQELEALAKTLVNERDNLQRELYTAQSANISYVHYISELDSNMAKIQQEYLNVKQKLEIQFNETEQQRLELQDYRSKAQRALLAKDAQIAELKSANMDGGSQNDSDLRIKYDALKLQLKQAAELQQNMQLQLDEVLLREKQTYDELIASRARETLLINDLRTAREYRVTLESEHRVVRQELDTLREQLNNHMASFATRLQEKEQQLQKLKCEPLSNINIDHKKDYECRLKALTQSLVERQSALERITAERNALRLQFEKVQSQIQATNRRDLENQRRISRNALLSNSTDDVKAQFPPLMHPNPFDNRVARRVKRAYTSLDSAGIRLGAFLRRYPLMRIGVLMYVALLHIWVIFVLFSSTPN